MHQSSFHAVLTSLCGTFYNKLTKKAFPPQSLSDIDEAKNDAAAEPCIGIETTFDGTDEIGSSQSRNYKVRCEVGLKIWSIAVVPAVVDTGAGPNLTRQTFRPPGFCKDGRTTVMWPRPEIAFGHALQKNGMDLLYVKICGNTVRVWFGVSDEFALKTFLGTSYIDRRIRNILSMEHRDVLK